MYKCRACARVFEGKNEIEQHFMKTHSSIKFTCNVCFASFKTVKNFQQHMTRFHSKGEKFACSFCYKLFSNREEKEKHEEEEHPPVTSFIIVASALSKNILQYRRTLKNIKTFEKAKEHLSFDIYNLVLQELKKHPVISLGIVLSHKFAKNLGEKNERIEIIPVRSDTTLVFLGDIRNLISIIQEKYETLLHRAGIVGNPESGWILLGITGADVEITHAHPLKGASMNNKKMEENIKKIKGYTQLQLLFSDKKK